MVCPLFKYHLLPHNFSLYLWKILSALWQISILYGKSGF